MHLTFAILCLFADHLLASPTPEISYVLHEKREGAHASQPRARANGDVVTTFTIALEQQNLQSGEALLSDISNPDSPHYGRHWTSRQVQESFAPSEESFTVVEKWLATSEIHSPRRRRNMLAFEASVRQIEVLLKTKYHRYGGLDANSALVGCDEYYVPEDVSQHIDYITPAVALSSDFASFDADGERVTRVMKREGSAPTANDQHEVAYYISAGMESLLEETKDILECGKQITPACLRALYSIPSPKEIAQDYAIINNNAIGVFEALSYYNQTDMDLFFAKYAPWIPQGTHPILQSVEGAKVLQSASASERTESNVDFEIVYSLVHPQPVKLYQVGPKIGYQGGSDSPAALNKALYTGMENLLDALDRSYCDDKDVAHGLDCGIYTPAQVFSISYATGEIDIPPRQQRRQCNEIMKLSLQGHTFISASGDFGVAQEVAPHDDGTWTNGCINRTDYAGTVASAVNGTVFNPSYPANCPYVLSVGATMLDDGETAWDSEVAMHMPRAEVLKIAAGKGVVPPPYTTSTGGGFSNYFTRPEYQVTAVDAYFASHDPGHLSYVLEDSSCTVQSASGNGGLYNRAGRGIPDVSANGAKFATFVDGQEAPQWGTSLAVPIWASLLTLVNQKRIAGGKGAVGFVQPVLYKHPEIFHDITAGANPGCGTDGFSAVAGWDPVTGLGTPSYPKLLEVFMNLP